MPKEPPPSTGLRSFDPMPTTVFAVGAPAVSMPVERLSPPLAAVFRFWLAAGAGAPPSRAAVDPAKLRGALGHVMLWDVLPDGGGYRCRLAGTAICEVAGRELRGMGLEEMYGRGSGVVREEFDRVRDHREAHLVERTMHWIARPYQVYRRLLLPLIDANGDVDALLAAVTFDKFPRRT